MGILKSPWLLHGLPTLVGEKPRSMDAATSTTLFAAVAPHFVKSWDLLLLRACLYCLDSTFPIAAENQILLCSSCFKPGIGLLRMVWRSLLPLSNTQICRAAAGVSLKYTCYLSSGFGADGLGLIFGSNLKLTVNTPLVALTELGGKAGTTLIYTQCL